MATQKEMMKKLGYMTVAEVAALVGRTEVTVYQWVEQKKIKARHVGRSIYILRSSVKAYLGDNARLFGFA